jgi:hypothetical protein
MQEYYAEEGVPQLVNWRTQPGHGVDAAPPEAPLQGLKSDMGDEVDDSTEDEDACEQRDELAEGGRQEVPQENKDVHFGCIIAAAPGAVKVKRPGRRILGISTHAE